MLAVQHAMRALMSLKAWRLVWAFLLIGQAQAALAQTTAPRPGSLPTASATVQPDASASPVRIFLPPPMSWDREMANMRPALSQGRSDFVAVTGGVAFGMRAEDVNALLPKPYAGMSWDAMSQALEYPGDVRYFWVPFNEAGPLQAGTKRCAGDGSYVVFLFNQTALFRLSYRLVPDQSCPSVKETARDIFGRYITIGETVTLTSRYHTGTAEVVDITDPSASFLIPIRWYQVGK